MCRRSLLASAFSDEWSTHYWKTKESINDHRLKSLEAWQKATEEDPLFAIDVHWLPYKEDSFGDIIVRMLEGDRDDYTLQEEIYENLVKEFLDDLQKTYEENTEALATQVSDKIVESLSDELIAALK